MDITMEQLKRASPGDVMDYEPYLTTVGPKQSRKPTTQQSENDKPQLPTYDPRALLNPKASVAKKSAAETVGSKGTEDSNESLGATSMLERLHNITDRDDAPNKRRKIATDDDPTDSKQKADGPFGSIGKGGTISDHLKEERKQIASKSENTPIESTSNTIDLTGEDDDEDVQVIEDRGNEEVCLGVLRSSVNAHIVPGGGAKFGKDWWPSIKVNYRRQSGKNTLIEILDNQGRSFGALESKLASALCPILDGSRVNKFRITIRLEQRHREQGEEVGQRISKQLKALVFAYSPRRLGNTVGRFLSQKQLFLASPPQNTGMTIENPHGPQVFGRPKAPGSQTTYVSRTAEEIRREATSMFDSLAKAEDLPESEANESIIKTPLMSHQKKALNFMMEHERCDYEEIDDGPAHSLWKLDKRRDGQYTWAHVITSEVVKEKPVEIQGGILADVMGLGKTLSILALVAQTNDASKIFRNREVPPNQPDVVMNAQGTLIICPKSVLANWQEQIENHVKPRKLKTYTYHGTSRMQDLYQLCKFDIVLTSYNTAATEIGDGPQSKRALASINWFRIVLDEAHSIRTVSTKISKACCALNAERRWAVTGTPLQNRLDDIGSLIKFLRVKPLDNTATWAQHIMSPLKLGQESAVDHLKLLMNSVTLRRVKETVGMVDRVEERVRLEFNKSEQLLYDEFAKRSATKFHTMTQGTNVMRGKAYAHVLKSLGRLRAICAHGREMLSEEDMKDIEGSDSSNAIVLDIGDEPGLENSDEFISERSAYETFTMMQDSEVDRCIDCDARLEVENANASPDANIDSDDESSTEDGDVKSDESIFGYLTPCYHLLCSKCKEKHKEEIAEDLTADDYYVCSHCGQYMRSGLFSLRRSGLQRFKDDRASVSQKSRAARWDENSYSGPHTKVKALLNDLKLSANETAALPPGEPPIRSVVFSGWTSYLDLIGFALEKNRIGFVRLDGKMTLRQRAQVLETFKTDNSITVLLVSIKAGGQGLNFTAANKVYVMEPQFNPGVEQQAVDRVHRLGQTRPVHIVHYIMVASVEEGILKLQKKKEDLAQMSLERKISKAEEAKRRLEELRELFK